MSSGPIVPSSRSKPTHARRRGGGGDSATLGSRGEMFSLRVHSVDYPRPSEGCRATKEPDPDPPASTSTSAPQPLPSPAITGSRSVLVSRGIVHLYRSSSPPSLSPDSLLPSWRGTLLFVLAVPTRLSLDDFISFCGSCLDRSSEIQLIRNDGIEDRYSVLIKFEDQSAADGFYLDINGWHFSSTEVEVCHVLFLASVEYTDSMEIAGTPPAGYTELPTCPVCLERLDQDISGIVATTCDHSFQCSCISKWVNPSCLVCQFCQEHSQKPTCSICGTSENLWICVICGFVGCGRYKEGHAFRHWKETQHCFSLDLEAQRVWDYVGDNYVHRLNQSRSDGKPVKSNSHCRTVDSCGRFECSVDSGVSGALFNSKVEAIADEYNRLLASQLENQRQYYESLLIEAKEKKKKYIAEAVEQAVTLKLQDLQLQIENVLKETKIASDMNAKLLKEQDDWCKKIKELEKRGRETLKLKDEKIRDLEEQIRDFTVCIEAQKKISVMEDADDIRGGTLLPVPSPQPSASRTRRSSKINRRRN